MFEKIQDTKGCPCEESLTLCLPDFILWGTGYESVYYSYGNINDGCIFCNIGPIYIKLKHIIKLGVLFLTMWVLW